MDTPAWDARIEDAGLSVRTVNALRGIGIKTLAEANELGRVELLRTPYLGPNGVAGLFDIIDARKAKYPTQPAVNAAQGMTLRDWFAGQALAWAGHDGWLTRDHENMAKRAYRMADAMIAARSGQ